VVLLLLTVLTTAVYYPVRSYPFINYDDPDYVSANPHVLEGLTWESVEWAFTTGYSANWHPVTWLSHVLDCQFYGIDAGWHHVTSLALHIANACLLFLLLVRATGTLKRSAVAAAIFALHPINVESVAWIAERKTVLSMFLCLVALGSYGFYLRQPSRKRYITICIFFALALAAKPMVITLPCLLLLLDYWPLGRVRGSTTFHAGLNLIQKSGTELLKEKIPLFVLSATSAVVTILVQKRGNAIQPLGQLSFAVRCENALFSYGMYILKLVWPLKLSVLYPHPMNTLTPGRVAGAAIFLVAATVLAWTGRKRTPYVLIGWLWFLGALVPMIGIIQVGGQGMADRYAYLPAIGIITLAVWGCADLISALSLPRFTGAALALTVLSVLSITAIRQIGYWRNSVELWSHTLAVTQDNYIANDFMGFALVEDGNVEAMDYFQRAAKISPTDPVSHGTVASNLLDQGKLQEAIPEYRTALQNNPTPEFQAGVYVDLGTLYRELGDYVQADTDSHLAMKLAPKVVTGLIDQLSNGLESHPDAHGYWRLGLMLEGTDRIAEARSAYEKAIQLDAHSPAQQALASLNRRFP
jgi:Flp pilus assembly protein TadD